MHKLLIIKAFEKAKLDLEKKGERKHSDNNLSIFISGELTEMGSSISPKSIIGYYNSAKEANEKSDISISQQSIVVNLCKYLGFDSYEDFVKANPNHGKKRLKEFLKKYRVLIVLTLVLLLGVATYTYVTRQRWMMWENDHYVEVKFDSELLSKGKLKAYKKERILYFKKIDPDCDTKFFNEDGSENLWYGKNRDGKLEYFTALGLHPETGKTLKHITIHMIKTHICESYK